MPLTDTAVRNAKPGAKPAKLFDERGLFLIVTPAGGKWWRLKYRYDKKEKLLSLGVYPDVGLKEARDNRDEARKLLAAGIDPGAHRKAHKSARADRAANSFEVVAREWFAEHSASWAKGHADKIIQRLERDVFPWVGGRAIADITAPELLTVVKRIKDRGALETAHRALGNCGRVFRYGVQTGRCERDPSSDLRGGLPPVRDKGHFAAVTDPKAVSELLRTLDSYQGSFTVACALRLAPLVFVRPGELRKAEWTQFDLEKGEWRYFITKTKSEHLVPLATQAVAILKELQPLTERGRFVFPGARSKERPMSDNAILAAMRRLGIAKEEMSGHGFRAMARTILDEVLGVRSDYIDHQLAHAVKDPNGRAYNRTAHLPERRKMMQQWADYLDKLKVGAEVIPIHQKA